MITLGKFQPTTFWQRYAATLIFESNILLWASSILNLNYSLFYITVSIFLFFPYANLILIKFARFKYLSYCDKLGNYLFSGDESALKITNNTFYLANLIFSINCTNIISISTDI